MKISKLLKGLVGLVLLAWTGGSLYILSTTNWGLAGDDVDSLSFLALLLVCTGAFFGILLAGAFFLNLLKKVEDRWVG